MLDKELARQVKWRNAVNPRPVAKVANMRTRMFAYQEELVEFRRMLLLLAIADTLVIGLIVCFLPNLAAKFSPTDAPISRDLSFWMLSAFAWVIIFVLPCLMMSPRRPTYEDVLADVALRRQVGMDDSISDD